MYKKILISLFVGLFGLLNTGLAYAGFFDYANSNVNSFSASTLFFNLTELSGDPIILPMFNASDLKPNAPQLFASFRINKEGTEDFKYNIYFVKTAGDDVLCSALNIEAKLDGTTLYDGSLSGLWIDPRPTIIDGTDDWELAISLFDSAAELREKNCSFDLVVKGWQTDSDGSWGFSDSDSLVGNELSTTTWEVADTSLGIEMLSQSSLVDDLISQESDPSAELSPDISEEVSIPLEEATDPTLTPDPTPVVTPTPEELIPTPILQEQEEEVGQGDSSEEQNTGEIET